MSCLLFWQVANFNTFQTLVFCRRFLGEKSCNLHYFIVFFNWTLHLKLQTRCRSIFKECYRKIPKISPGADIFQRLFLWSLSTEGNLRFKISGASPIVGSKFAVFALFYFAFEGNFPSTSPRGGLYLEALILGIL